MKKNFNFVSNLVLKAKDGENPEAGGTSKSKAASTEEKKDGDNIESEIDKGMSLSEETAEEAAKQIAKENKERRIEETKALMMKSAYARGKQLLVLRRERRKEEAAKQYLVDLSKLDEELKAGKHDKMSYDKGFKEAYKKRDEKLREIDKTYREYWDKLKKLYPVYWSFEWDYNID